MIILNNSVEYIQENIDKIPVDVIISDLGISRNRFYKILEYNNIQKNNKYIYSEYKGWTYNEITYLKENYPIKTTLQIANELERSYSSVGSKIKKLKLKKG